MSLALTDRMKAIAGLSGTGDILFDVGCDHALISISLLMDNRFRLAVASDINEGPLKAARQNAEKAGVSDRMEFLQSDGLTDIDVASIKQGHKKAVLIISGMGGELIQRILSESAEKLDLIDELILSPQSKLNVFRRYLGGEGFKIKQEKTVFDKGKYYFVIEAVRGKDACKDETDYELGPYFFEDRSPLKEKLLNDRLLLYEKLCLNKKIDEENLMKYRNLLNIYREALNRYEMP